MGQEEAAGGRGQRRGVSVKAGRRRQRREKEQGEEGGEGGGAGGGGRRGEEEQGEAGTGPRQTPDPGSWLAPGERLQTWAALGEPTSTAGGITGCSGPGRTRPTGAGRGGNL